MRELLAEQLERNAVLQAHADGRREGVHEARDGGAFLGHADEDFTGAAVGVEPDGDVAFVAGDAELVRDAGALGGQAVADGAGRALLVGCVGVFGAVVEELVELGFECGELGLGR